MANTSDFVAWATGVGANVDTPANYASTPALQLGAQSGVASSKNYNNALRQGTSIAAMIAQFMANYGPSNVLDNGNIAALEAQFLAALQAQYVQKQFVWDGVDAGSVNSLSITTTPAINALVAGLVVIVHDIAATNTGATVLNVDGLGGRPCVFPNGAAFTGGELVGGGDAAFEYSGTNWVMISPPPLPFFDARYPKIAIPQSTFYVNGATGNDSNPGTSAAPFQTLQGAINYISQFYSQNTVTVNIAAGTYTPVSAYGAAVISIPSCLIASWNFVGAGYSTTILDGSAIGHRGLSAGPNTNVTLTNVTIKGYIDIVVAYGSVTLNSPIEYTFANSSTNGISALTGSTVTIAGATTTTNNLGNQHTFTNAGNSAFNAEAGGQINLGVVNSTYANIAFSTTAAFGAATAVASGGTIYNNYSITNWYGSTPAGYGESATANGVIKNNGGGTSNIPGSLGPASSTYGGQLVP